MILLNLRWLGALIFFKAFPLVPSLQPPPREQWLQRHGNTNPSAANAMTQKRLSDFFLRRRGGRSWDPSQVNGVKMQ